MADHEWLAQQFEQNRPHLQAIAYRMLGSFAEADDAVQEAWLRLSRADAAAVENLGGWLTTVVARLCLDMLRARRSRREQTLESNPPRVLKLRAETADPEREALLADSIGFALLIVLETLAPAERVAFVLHDVFDVPFEEIAPVVGRTPVAARQLASRARRRVQHASRRPAADLQDQQRVVRAFLAAARDGDFEGLLALLDPEAGLDADRASVRAGAPRALRGANAVAGMFVGRAQAAQPAVVDGGAAFAWAPGGRPRVIFALSIAGGKIAHVRMISAPSRVRRLRVDLLER